MSIGSMINFRVLHGIHGQSSGYVRRVSYSRIVQMMRKSVHREGGVEMRAVNYRDGLNSTIRS